MRLTLLDILAASQQALRMHYHHQAHLDNSDGYRSRCWINLHFLR
jgi:hypothetical protein